MSDWHAHLLESTAAIQSLLRTVQTVAVLGIKPDSQSGQAAFYVPEYVARAGFTVVPVPVYYPDVTTILGRPVYRSLVEVPGPVDLVNVFRRSTDVAQHVDDILAKRPRAVWMQSGISNEMVAEKLAREGIDVVQDRCLMVELRRMGR